MRKCCWQSYPSIFSHFQAARAGDLTASGNVAATRVVVQSDAAQSPMIKWGGWRFYARSDTQWLP